MDKVELKRIALRYYNKGVENDIEVEFCEELDGASDSKIQKCIDYLHQLFRIGKHEFKKRHRL
jgi:hypothetical protein